jgi:hypothetical protein
MGLVFGKVADKAGVFSPRTLIFLPVIFLSVLDICLSSGNGTTGQFVVNPKRLNLNYS